MKDSIRRSFLVVAGVYLIYTGGRLTIDVIGSFEKTKWVFLAFAALFLGFGAAVLVMNIKGLIQDRRENEEKTDGAFPEEREEETESKDREEDSHCG